MPIFIILLALMGLVILIKGEIPVTKTYVLKGTPAYIVGGLVLAPAVLLLIIMILMSGR